MKLDTMDKIIYGTMAMLAGVLVLLAVALIENVSYKKRLMESCLMDGNAEYRCYDMLRDRR
jgi:hypothetical protein